MLLLERSDFGLNELLGGTRGGSSAGHEKRRGLSIKEFPRIGPVEAPDGHRPHKLRFKVSQVHAVPGSKHSINRFPVGDAPAGVAPEISKAAVTPHVALRVLRMAFDGHGPELVVRPYASRAAAQRAVATRRRFRCRRQSDTNRPTVAGSVQRRRRLFVVHGVRYSCCAALTPELSRNA